MRVPGSAVVAGLPGAGRQVVGVELPCDGNAVGEIEVRGPWITGSYYQDEVARQKVVECSMTYKICCSK